MALSREVLRSLAEQSGQAEGLLALQAQLTLEDIHTLRTMVEEEKLRNAQVALSLAEVAEAIAPLLADDGEGYALAWWAMGNALYHHNHYADALIRYRRAADWYQARGQWLEVARLQINQMAVLQEKGEYREALELEVGARRACEAAGEGAVRFLAGLEMNLSSTYHQMGKLSEALAACKRGKTLFLQLGNRVAAARLTINRANILRDKARYAQAEALLNKAHRTLRAAEQWQEVARAEMNLGLVHYVQGNYQRALHHFELSRDGFQACHNPIEVAVIDLYRSAVYLHLNLLDEALSLVTQAGGVFEQDDQLLYQLGEALVTQGVAYQRQQRYKVAQGYLTRAQELLYRQGATERGLLLGLERAWLAFEMGELSVARSLCQWVSDHLDPNTWPAQHAQICLLLARCDLREPHPPWALLRQRGEEALTVSQRYRLWGLAVRAYHLLGQVSEQEEGGEQGLAYYQDAIRLVEMLRGGLALDEFQAGFMDDKLALYEDAVRVSEQLEQPAFLLYYLTLAAFSELGSTIPSALSPMLMAPADREIWDALQVLRRAWHGQQAGADVATPAGLRSATAWQSEQPTAPALEEAIAEGARRFQVRILPIATSLSPAPPRTHTEEARLLLIRLQNHLAEQQAFLHFYVVGDTFKVLVVTRQGATPLTLGPTAPLRRLMQSWTFGVSQVPQLRNPTLRASLDGFAMRHLRHFYETLFAPLEQYLADQSELFLVLPPEWHTLPVAAFFDGHRHLVERFRLTHLSSVSALWGQPPPKRSASSRQLHALLLAYSNEPDAGTGQADGTRPPRPLSSLPHAPQEAEQARAVLDRAGHCTVLLNQAATLERFREASQRSDLLHFATHALFRPDNPFFSWMLLADGRLTVSDLYELALPQRPLVVLSACETGLGRPRGGGLLGLGRGFLAAGATGLVVSLWKVEDASTARWMEHFYGHLDLNRPLTMTAASALQQTQCWAIREGWHPFLWAAFVFVGG